MTSRVVTLTVQSGPEAGRSFVVPEGPPRRFGSSSGSDEVLAHDAAIAPAHLAVRWEGGVPRARALQSACGTWLNGAAFDDAALRDGDDLCIGVTHLRVRWSERAPTPPPIAPADPRAAALATLRAAPGRLYAVLDAARDDRVRELMRRSSYRIACLYDGWGEDVFGEAAPWLVQLWKTGRLVEQLIEEGMGKGWGLFLTSRAPFVEVRRQCRRLLQVKVEGQGRMLFRWYDPGVMLSVHPHMDRAQLHGAVINAWIVESREGDRLITLA